MKNITILSIALLILISFKGISQNCTTAPTTATPQFKLQKISIVISTNDTETVWSAFRLATYSIVQGDTVSVLLPGKAVESPDSSTTAYNVKEMMQPHSGLSGKLFACGTCLTLRQTEGTKPSPVSSPIELYAIIKTNQIALTF